MYVDYLKIWRTKFLLWFYLTGKITHSLITWLCDIYIALHRCGLYKSVTRVVA